MVPEVVTIVGLTAGRLGIGVVEVWDGSGVLVPVDDCDATEGVGTDWTTAICEACAWSVELTREQSE